ncbi:MAG: C45 family autoproteolytic acyltransferase/hydrolase [Candidatus Thorarchaeota archaeon]
MVEISNKGKKFPIIDLKGDSVNIGLQHGRILKKRIIETINWYKTIIPREEAEILSLATHFQSKISQIDPNYCDEIEGIASGAEVDPLWIYALNSRSEIMNTFTNECTAIYFKDTALLGQNWDWAKELEKLAIILRIKSEDKPEILMMTEPGIIGKIGLNSQGIGVCLNFLDSGQVCKGVPVHILLRVILDSTSMEEAIHRVDSFKIGKSANIIIGDAQGGYVDFEFANQEIYEPKSDSKVFLHTNHYLLNEELNVDQEKLANSFARYKQALQLVQNFDESSLNAMKRILLDQTRSDMPICRPYVSHPDLGNVGTVCSIIMDLRGLKMHITLGNPLKYPFTSLGFE